MASKLPGRPKMFVFAFEKCLCKVGLPPVISWLMLVEMWHLYNIYVYICTHIYLYIHIHIYI